MLARVATLPYPVRAAAGAALTREVRKIRSKEEFAALRDSWEALAANVPDCPGHMTFDYCELAAERVLTKGGSVSVAMVFSGSTLLALWPLAIVTTGLLRLAKGLTCGTGDEYGGPLVDARANAAVYAAAVAAVRQVDADVLEVALVRHGSPLQRALDQGLPQSWVRSLLPERWRGLPGFTASLRDFPRWDDYVSTRSKSLRSTLRYRHKRLDAQGRAEFGWCRTVGDAAFVLRWLLENKRRWARVHGAYVPYLRDDGVRDFFIALARRTDLRTMPIVSYVRVDGVPVAASINLVGTRTVEGLVTTYDERFAACSVGALLAEFLIKWAHSTHRNFDFRPLYANYKESWANCRTWHETRVAVIQPRGRLIELSQLLVLLGRVKRKLFGDRTA
jgi:CelD/BcsL family acetyltransferase involved in cellulose biosynthesis